MLHRSMSRRLFEAILLLSWFASPSVRAEPAVDFSGQVLPLLRKACWECHGAEKQEGSLRLDRPADVFRGGDSGDTVVPGKSADSELLRRIQLPKDDPEVMPARGNRLTANEVQLLQDWIDSGAAWPADAAIGKHWAYVAPQRPAIPAVKQAEFVQTPIDAFVLQRLEKEGLAFSPKAAKTTLVRRLYFDLIGIPPTPAQVDAFVNDTSELAVERLVDELLASKQFGVKWARPWLDYARYADSHGFQRDDFRDLWPYRDWVVDALNADMPFDQFTIEQLAGDLLPNATAAQRIATGFNRSAPTNVEAGSDPEETRVNQVLDRVNTLGMIWLGTTLECCQCHDHKYDPFTSRDYYGLFAFFNDTQIEADRSNPKVPGSIRFLGPTMTLKEQQSPEESEVRHQLAQVETQLKQRATALEEDHAWEKVARSKLDRVPQEEVLSVVSFESLEGATHQVLDDQSVLLSGEAPDKDTYVIVLETKLTDISALKLETLTDASLPGSGPGRGDEKRPNFVAYSCDVEIAPLPSAEQRGAQKPQGVKFRHATADFSQNNYDVGGLIDDKPETGWAINPEFHKPHWAILETSQPIGFKNGSRLTVRIDQHFGGARTIGRLRFSALVGDLGTKAIPHAVVQALRVPLAERKPEQVKALAEYRQREDAEYQQLASVQQRLTNELKKFKPPTTLVMQQVAESRVSMIFPRGDFRSATEKITADTPAQLPPLQIGDEVPRDRLALAQWLMRADNPLVARVVVNRWWSELFGHGLVTTPEDFGIKGEPPTHPELLDWLAVEFREQGWSLKHILRLIVTSRTYQQDSRLTPDMLARDDQNLLYARGPRFRLSAEAIRDNALAMAGLLDESTGGPPIRPYQPDGLWIKVGGEKYDYVVSPGTEKYRRGLYVVWKRGAPYPSFVNFDANARLACRVKRPRANTPLQALTLMNDPVYVEAALAFAKRIIVDTNDAPDDAARIQHAFRIALARSPKPAEEKILLELLAYERSHPRAPAALQKLLAPVKLPEKMTAAEFAPWYAVATTLLNLDATITKE